MTDEIDEIKQKSIDVFTGYYNNLPNDWIIEGKSFHQWCQYFDVKIGDTNELYVLRDKYTQVSDRLDQCYNIYSNLQLAGTISAMDESLYIAVDTDKIYQDKNNKIKSVSGAEKQAEKNNISKTTTRMFSEMSLKAWKEQINKLNSKLKVLETRINSIATEMKAVGHL